MGARADVIVGAAILDRQGRVLAAQRAAPPELAGWWEFPGGKVEPGESDEDGLVRECREELGVDIRLGDRLGDDVGVGDAGAVLRIWLARVADGGEPVCREHRALRWLSVDELHDVAWLPADLPLVAELAAVLGRTGPGRTVGWP